MDFDIDGASQSTVSAPSLSWWMMKNLWQQGVPDERHLRLSIADTFLLEDGHLMYWYFTSANSGLVLKHSNKRLEWDELLKFLLRYATRSQRSADSGSRGSTTIAIARRLREGRTYAVLLTEVDLKSLREKHNAHLLDEIVVIQPYMEKTSFTGCGLFETEFQRNGRHRGAQATLATYELSRWPEADIKWSTEFANGADRAGSHDSCSWGRKSDSSSERVHGIVHRMLAATTKSIVKHIERETEETIMRVSVQYVFRPGTGRPTLFWLDSVRTLLSTEGDDRNEEGGEEAAEEEEFVQLTRELREPSRDWTTFFPPKMFDIASGGSAGGANMPAWQRSCNSSRVAIAIPFPAEDGIPQDPSDFFPGTATFPLVNDHVEAQPTQDSVPVPLPPEHDVVVKTPSDEWGSEYGTKAEEGGSSRPNKAGLLMQRAELAGGQRQRFALPTSSWARRSDGWRGLYSSRGWGSGCPDRPATERWPRKRSTGTMMRLDGRRPDLRHAFEERRPSTAHPGGLKGVEWDGIDGKDRRGEQVYHRLASNQQGCYGDYCHSEDHRVHIDAKKSSEEGSRRCADAPLLSKLVSYRSIIKCRAEEKALMTWKTEGVPHDYGGIQSLTETGDLRERTSPLRKKNCHRSLSSAVADRMHLLAANLSKDGLSEYFKLGWSDRKTAESPETVQRGVEQLLYEEAMSRLHPTTACRAVPVCDACSMVYGYMDAYRQHTKRLKASANNNSREARILFRRKALRGHQGNVNRVRSLCSGHESKSYLRRYSDLNLEAVATVPCDGGTSNRQQKGRDSTKGGYARSSTPYSGSAIKVL